MKHGYWIRNGAPHDPRTVVELAIAAEEGGWDGVFVSDAVAESHTEPWTHLAAIAAATERVTLGTWVTPLVARDVVHVARSIANVDQLSGGRVVVGLGLGNQVEHDALGVRRERLGARYDAALDVLAALLAGDAVTRHDDWFDLQGVQLNVRPVQSPRPPFLIGCNWPADRPMRRAARWEGSLPYWAGVDEEADDSPPNGRRQQELRALIGVYRDAGGDGTVLVPRYTRFGPDYDALCEELGVTWQLTMDDLDAATLRQGPPA